MSDQLRIASQFKSRVISVSLDPKASILMGGHSASAAYWYDNQNGNWITSDYYVDSLSPWVNELNSKKLPDIYLSEVWQPVLPISDYTESHPDNNTYEKGFSGKKTFPYDLKTLSSEVRNKRNYETLKYTPFGNTYTKDLAIASIVNENLGKDEFTDWLYISFSANSFIGKNFSSWSVEMEDTYIRLDKDLEHLLNFIDEQAGLRNVLVYLTAENAVAEDPAYLTDNGMPSGFFNYNNAMYLLRTYLNLIYGTGEWVRFYYAQQVYLNRQLIEDSKLSFNDFQDKVAGFMIQFEGVANALTANNLMTNNYTRGYFNKIQKSFNQKRSGDVLIHLSPGWVEKGADTEYASALRFDTHVPLVFYGWKVGRTIITRPVSVTDIMPSIAVLMDLTRPGSIEGNLIEELF